MFCTLMGIFERRKDTRGISASLVDGTHFWIWKDVQEVTWTWQVSSCAVGSCFCYHLNEGSLKRMPFSEVKFMLPFLFWSVRMATASLVLLKAVETSGAH